MYITTLRTGPGIARIEKSLMEGWERKVRGRISRREGGPTLKQRCTYIKRGWLCWPLPSILTGKRGEALAEALPALLYFEGSLILMIPGFLDS